MEKGSERACGGTWTGDVDVLYLSVKWEHVAYGLEELVSDIQGGP